MLTNSATKLNAYRRPLRLTANLPRDGDGQVRPCEARQYPRTREGKPFGQPDSGMPGLEMRSTLVLALALMLLIVPAASANDERRQLATTPSAPGSHSLP